MTQNIGGLDISSTYRNVLLLNTNSLTGCPANFNTPAAVSAARVQDGLGNPTHLLVSKSDIGVDVTPKSYLSLVRAIDLMDSFTQAQNNSLIF